METIRRVLDTPLNATTAVTLVTLAISFAIAEPFFKFHSFTLETLAFLATWWVLRRLGLLIVRR
ncbi:MAG TPA: hypothetical protein VGR87_09690 [Candidatus Limnocylindria bacterium]|jgi:hypothetical protein|nr:hypothetical protein [Candidatus Limnocylindria bacterium]